MPYELKKVGRKYQVITTATGKPHSKEPMSKKKAEAQLRVLNEHTDVVEHLGGSVGDVINNYISNMSTLDKVEMGLAFTPVGNVFALGRLALNLMRRPTKTYAPTDYELMAREAIEREEYKANEAADRELGQLQRKLARQPKFRDITDAEVNQSVEVMQKNAQAQNLADALYNANRRDLVNQINSERLAKQRLANEQRTEQNLAGLNQKSQIIQAQATSAKQALAQAKLLQQQRMKDQQLFLTKANDIKRSDFFQKERQAQEAKQLMIDAEQRRQAIRATAQQIAAAATVMPSTPNNVGEQGPQMIPTLGARLPPSLSILGKQLNQ
jgi:hypothetical protein